MPFKFRLKPLKKKRERGLKLWKHDNQQNDQTNHFYSLPCLSIGPWTKRQHMCHTSWSKSFDLAISFRVYDDPKNERKCLFYYYLFIGIIICWTSKVMVLCWRTPTLEHFARRHSGLVKLGHKTSWTGCSRLRREKISFWTFGVPKRGWTSSEC